MTKKKFNIIKSGNYYEPIYYVIVDSKEQLINTPFFNKNIKFTPINNVLKLANKSTNEMCVPLPSMPKIYNFVSNINASKVLDLLLKSEKILVKNQVINYSGQTIAFIVELNQKQIYILHKQVL